MDPLTIIVVVTSLAWAWVVYRLALSTTGVRDMPAVELSDVPRRLSVILTACNEAQTIGRSLASLRTQSHPDFEIIAVNDRSTDATGAILDRIALEDPRVRVVHIDHLPDGWLGKVHAMHRGAEVASGDWLLFSDADVVFNADTLRDAVHYAQQEDLDHLSLLPEMITKGALLEAATIGFAQVLFLIIGVGTRSPHPLGIGAFNLVRKTALDRSLGIEWIKMEIADDTGLALLITNAGGRTRFHLARDRLSLEWYPSVIGLIRGLEKNAFIMGGNGSVWRVSAVLLAVGTLILMPWVGLLFGPTPLDRIAGASAIGSFMLVTAWGRMRLGVGPWGAIFAHIGISLVGISAAWSTIQCVRNGGIDWRGTHYPLQALRDGKRVYL